MSSGATYGWGEIDRERKREIIAAIAEGRSTRGPVHAELDLTDRCNVACYFCNQQDVRTKEFVCIDRAKEIIDELADGGLRSVRLSGGGDPLFHKDILALLDHLSARGIVIDNLTTNAVLLTDEVAARLVRDEAREVVVSLNAVDPDDYHRMMKVKGSLFDRVVANVRQLVAARGAGKPVVVIQYLIDRANYARVVEMYELARSLGADRVAINPVMDIPRERIDQEMLLADEDAELLRPYLHELFERDRDARLLQIFFPTAAFNRVIGEAKGAAGYSDRPFTPTASSFREENGQCFFAWYTMTVRGNGDLYPCCLLMNPDYEPLGNVAEGSITAHWNGASFNRLRSEMREVLVRGGKVFYQPQRFKTIRKQCIEEHACWLKNMYFRGDEEFYGELARALDEARRREVRMVGSPRSMARAVESAVYSSPRLRSAYDRFRIASRPFRLWLKKRLRLNVAGVAVRESQKSEGGRQK